MSQKHFSTKCPMVHENKKTSTLSKLTFAVIRGIKMKQRNVIYRLPYENSHQTGEKILLEKSVKKATLLTTTFETESVNVSEDKKNI